MNRDQSENMINSKAGNLSSTLLIKGYQNLPDPNPWFYLDGVGFFPVDLSLCFGDLMCWGGVSISVKLFLPRDLESKKKKKNINNKVKNNLPL